MPVDLDAADRELIGFAQEALRKLYVKDRHEVAAAVRTGSGEVFAGIHIEAEWGSRIFAAR